MCRGLSKRRLFAQPQAARPPVAAIPGAAIEDIPPATGIAFGPIRARPQPKAFAAAADICSLGLVSLNEHRRAALSTDAPSHTLPNMCGGIARIDTSTGPRFAPYRIASRYRDLRNPAKHPARKAGRPQDRDGVYPGSSRTNKRRPQETPKLGRGSPRVIVSISSRFSIESREGGSMTVARGASRSQMEFLDS